MIARRWIGVAIVAASSGISLLWGLALNRTLAGGLTDFKGIYYPAKCLLQHRDPYKDGEILRVYQEDGGDIPTDPVQSRVFRRSVGTGVNLPTTFVLAAPFALLSWNAAKILWVALIAVSFSLGAYLVWEKAADYALAPASLLIVLLLANNEVLFLRGNTAGPVIGLCAIAVWCFLEDRYIAAGVLCMALSLAVKPHDTGFVWLYFLIAGGRYRKRALQTLAATAAIAAAAIVWLSIAAPDWIPEMRANLGIISARGDLNDPGVAGMDGRIPDAIVDLQAVVGMVKDDPQVYNAVSYTICGVLLVFWGAKALRPRGSQAQDWMAIAVAAALSMLPTYHRAHDAKLLLLTIPACALIWAGSGLAGWIALLLEGAGLLLIGEVSLAVVLLVTGGLHPSTNTFAGASLNVLLTRPTPIVLLAMTIFFLWAYWRLFPRCEPQPDPS